MKNFLQKEDKMKTPFDIYKEARLAGDAAVKGAVDGYPCGFAYLNIKPARGAFVKWLKDNKIGRTDSYQGGYTLSSYDCCAFSGQNMDVKTDGVAAFNKVLGDNGVNANLYSRMD